MEELNQQINNLKNKQQSTGNDYKNIAKKKALLAVQFAKHASVSILFIMKYYMCKYYYLLHKYYLCKYDNLLQKYRQKKALLVVQFAKHASVSITNYL